MTRFEQDDFALALEDADDALCAVEFDGRYDRVSDGDYRIRLVADKDGPVLLE